MRCRQAGLNGHQDLSLSAILTSSGNDLACIFFHDLAAIHFDGRFAGTEFRCDLLVKHPGDDEVHFTLANAEFFHNDVAVRSTRHIHRFWFDLSRSPYFRQFFG